MYCTPAEVREVATAMTDAAKSSSSPANIATPALATLIERASRYFDLCCGVEPGYFEPAYYPVWESLHVYVVGDIVTPTTRQLHKYRITTAGTSAATEPTFPTGSGATVTSGGVTFTEYGADVIATNKTLYGDGTNYLRLPPYVSGSLDSVLIYPSGWTALTFIERDGYLIQTTSDGIAAPFLRYSSGWYRGVPIVVSAIWGWESTPAEVKLAIIEFVINLWRETDPAALKLVSIDNQPLREKLPPRIAEIARRYRVKKAAFV